LIAVDTSALLAIALSEPEADACIGALEVEEDVLISAGTLAEMLVVAGRRGLGEAAARLVGRFGMTVVPVTEDSARRVGDAYSRWGRGVHPAGLNFGDCFAYAVAMEHACGLLYLGNDFSRTDIQSVL
jgi:ribonuclease VapC